MSESGVGRRQPYIPPKWHEIAPLLYYAVLVWCFLLSVAFVREITDWVLRSRLRRALKARSSSSSVGTGVLGRTVHTLTVLYKKLRLTLARWKIDEHDLIWNIKLPRCIAGVFVCAFYCINTHTKSVTPFFYFVQVLYGLVAVLCLIYDFIYDPHPLVFLFQPRVFVECLTIPSLLLADNKLWLNLNFLQAYSILTIWYNLEKHEIVLKNADHFVRFFAPMSLELATFVFITACGVHFFELLGDPGDYIAEKMFYITWANALYFAVVTLMTVGYGDFVPFTFFGRVWIVVHIIRAAFLVVREMDLLSKTEAIQRTGIESYVETMEYNHVVVTGHVKWEFLKNFVVEFLKEGSNENTKVVVLTCSRTWAKDDWGKFISRNFDYDYRVFYVEGSPLEHSDLERARVISARAVFVFSDPHRGDPYREDADCLKSILSIRKYGGNVPIFTFNISQNSSAQFSIAMQQIEDEILLDSYSAPFPSNNAAQDNMSESGVLDLLNTANEETPLVVRESPARLLDISNSNLWQDADVDNLFYSEKKRSGESLCTQELEMALLAENVYCNGLSTLLANLTLRFAPVPKPKDRFWLLEYKLGAQCCIVPFEIPAQFNNCTYETVATLLQDYGIIILSVYIEEDKRWRIITVDTMLKTGMEAMIITYHATNSVKFIMERLLDKFEQNKTVEHEAEPPPSYPHSFDSVDNSLRSRLFNPERRNLPDRTELTRSHSQNPTGSFADHSFLASSSLRGGPEIRTVEGAAPGRDPFSDDEEDRLDLSRVAFQLPDRTTHSTAENSPPAFMLGGLPTIFDIAGGHSGGPSSADEKPVDRLTDRLTDRFTDRLTHSSSRSDSTRDDSREKLNGMRNRRSSQALNSERKGTTPRIYSSLHDISESLSNHVIVCLDGEHSLKSLKLLLDSLWKKRREQRRRTKVVVIHPNFPKNFDREFGNAGNDLFLLRGHSLSVQTLEQARYSTSRGMLILTSERSGSDSTTNTDSKAIFTVMTLDSLRNRESVFVCCMLDAEDSLRLMRAPRHHRRITFSGSDSGSIGDEKVGPIPRSVSGTYLASMYCMNYGSIATRPSFEGRGSLEHDGRSGEFQSRGSNLVGTLGRDAVGDDSSESQRTESRAKSEGELCERQRYASGEMIISSLYAALLVREEAQPGFIQVLRTLLGLEPAGGSWIRLLQIPEVWTQAALPEARTYRDTTQHLATMGCVAIGLYRSGRAVVRYMKSEKDGSFERSQEGVSYNLPTMGGGRHWALQGAWGRRSGSNDTPPADPRFEDRQPYTCPSTGRVIEYEEFVCDNVLPYVYCFPEPYTVVDPADGVFVLCDPEKEIASDWGIDLEMLAHASVFD